jgi:two-component system nitrate/nitrite response regulator NarL
MQGIFHKLSSRELMVLQLVAEGMANKMIARRLDLTEATVKVHIKSILRKLGLANRTQAAVWFMRGELGRQVELATAFGLG